MNPESPFLIFDTSLPAFEMAVEEQIADFFLAAFATTGGPLDGVRILAAIRDYDVTADAADAENRETATYAGQQQTKATNALKPRITFVGTSYKRLQGQDQCNLDAVIVVDLKHHSRSVFSAIVNHFRAVTSLAIISDLTDAFNTWATQIGTTGYKLQLQGLIPESSEGPGPDDTSYVLRLRYTARGYYTAA